jgi:glycine C-acetyltransferase
MTDPGKLSVEEKRKLVQQMLQKKKAEQARKRAEEERANYAGRTYDMFMFGNDPELSEVHKFDEWVQAVYGDNKYTFEVPRAAAQKPEADLLRDDDGSRLSVVNLSSYNYLGFGFHPQVVQAAKDALDLYGLGCASSPVSSGTMQVHRELERRLVEFIGLPGFGVSLFSAGYNVNTGTISALMRQGSQIVLDQSMHMSIVEGAQLSGATIHTFEHNNPASLERVVSEVADGKNRVLICVEGVYSADGDFGALAEIVEIARRHKALVLDDEAHSILLCGPRGRGVAAAQGVLDGVDLLVITFSKGFGGVGGALLAKKEITQYVNWYARSRMFSCALDPAVTAGITRALELAAGPEGDARRARLTDNARHLRSLLQGKVRLIDGESWIIPVVYGSERLTMAVSDFVQRNGLDSSVMQFPAVPKDASRMRLFVTSEHTTEQLDRAAEIIIRAAREFGFEA